MRAGFRISVAAGRRICARPFLGFLSERFCDFCKHEWHATYLIENSSFKCILLGFFLNCILKIVAQIIFEWWHEARWSVTTGQSAWGGNISCNFAWTSFRCHSHYLWFWQKCFCWNVSLSLTVMLCSLRLFQFLIARLRCSGCWNRIVFALYFLLYLYCAFIVSYMYFLYLYCFSSVFLRYL